MILEGLSSVCAKLESASCKNNEILEINVLQKLTLHALSCFKSLENGHFSTFNTIFPLVAPKNLALPLTYK